MLVNLNDILFDAQKRKYAVGLFNFVDTDLLEATISAAEEMRSPIIIGTAEVLLPYGELKLLAPAMVEAAKRASVPVVVHYDHGLTFNRCMEALQLGFSSIMYDGSAESIKENRETTRQIVKIAHAFGATVEGEVGHVGLADQGDDTNANFYTTVEEACTFVQETGVDALAIAIGTAHGAYTAKPHLDIARLSDIHRALETPLVLHGGSGLSDEDFQNTIRHGITKINIFTDLCEGGLRGIQEGLTNRLSYLEIRNRKVASAKQTVLEKIRLFGSDGKA